MAQLASALAWGARGRLFESDHPDKDMMRVCDNADPLYFYLFVHSLHTTLSDIILSRIFYYLIRVLFPGLFLSGKPARVIQ